MKNSYIGATNMKQNMMQVEGNTKDVSSVFALNCYRHLLAFESLFQEQIPQILNSITVFLQLRQEAERHMVEARERTHTRKMFSPVL